MKTATKTFWQDLNGRIACDKHLGAEASGWLKSRPTRNTITTSTTKWFRMTEADQREFADFNEIKGTICETCRHSK